MRWETASTHITPSNAADQERGQLALGDASTGHVHRGEAVCLREGLQQFPRLHADTRCLLVQRDMAMKTEWKKVNANCLIMI